MNLKKEILPLLGRHIGISGGQQGWESLVSISPLYHSKLPSGLKIGSLFAIGNLEEPLCDRLVIAKVVGFVQKSIGEITKVRVANAEILGTWFGEYLKQINVFFPVDKYPNYLGDNWINQKVYWLTGKARKRFLKAKTYMAG